MELPINDFLYLSDQWKNSRNIAFISDWCQHSQLLNMNMIKMSEQILLEIRKCPSNEEIQNGASNNKCFTTFYTIKQI